MELQQVSVSKGQLRPLNISSACNKMCMVSLASDLSTSHYTVGAGSVLLTLS